MKPGKAIDRQLDVMNLLWERGPSSSREIHHGLSDGASLSAIRTLVHNLEEEGSVRAELRGGEYRYCPALTRREFGRKAVRHVLRRYFEGSGLAFLHALAETAGWPEETVRPLWDRLKKAKSESWLTARSV